MILRDDGSWLISGVISHGANGNPRSTSFSFWGEELRKFMSERENLPRIERQLRLYEMVCQYVIVQFFDVCEIFPYNMCLLQRDLADLRDAGLVGVKFTVFLWGGLSRRKK
jgi:hypothetical protein